MSKAKIPLFLFFLAAVSAGAAEIVVTSPAAGAVWTQGTEHAITWTATGSMDASVKIILRQGSAVIQRISDSARTSAGTFTWRVTAALPSGSYTIKVKTLDNAVEGDSPPFTVGPPRVVSAAPLSRPVRPVSIAHTMTLPVTFTTKTRAKHEYWWNCLARSGTAGESVPPNELLVGFENHTVDRGPTCTDECVSLVYRGRPSFPDLMPLVGKELIKATLSFRHKRTESNPVVGSNCLYKMYLYASPISMTNPSPYDTRMLAVSISGTYEYDVTDIIGRWLGERSPTYHGEMHNYAIEFGGGNERFECNNQKCLSWFHSGSLEIKYRD